MRQRREPERVRRAMADFTRDPVTGMFDEAAASAAHRPTAFDRRVRELLQVGLPSAAPGMLALRPQRLNLDVAAEQRWLDFYNEIEDETGDTGKYALIRDVATRMPEQAARIAGVLHLIEHGPETLKDAGEVDDAAMMGGVALARWHLHEAMRVYGALAEGAGVQHAKMLVRWWLKVSHGGVASARDIMRNAPLPLRLRANRDRALGLLMSAGYVRICQKDPVLYEINSAVSDETL
jgi:hypothetical protein